MSLVVGRPCRRQTPRAWVSGSYWKKWDRFLTRSSSAGSVFHSFRDGRSMLPLFRRNGSSEPSTRAIFSTPKSSVKICSTVPRYSSRGRHSDCCTPIIANFGAHLHWSPVPRHVFHGPLLVKLFVPSKRLGTGQERHALLQFPRTFPKRFRPIWREIWWRRRVALEFVVSPYTRDEHHPTRHSGRTKQTGATVNISVGRSIR